MSTLFRREVIEARADRVLGSVVIAQPLSIGMRVAALCLLCVLAIAWVALGTYARTESVAGVLVTDMPAPRIVAPQAGIVLRLNVHEGSEVREGDQLATISLDRSSENGDGVAKAGIDAINARLGIGQQQIQVSADKASSERARLTSAASSADAQVSALDEQIALQRETVASSQRLFEQIGPIMERGYVSRLEYERRHQAYLASRQALGALVQQRLVQVGQAAQARAQLGGLASDVARENNDIRSSLETLRQQRVELDGQRSYVVRAPAAGRVSGLQTSLGSTAAPGATLMTIVPEASRMLAEVYAPSRAIGFLKPGQETRLLYDAYPYERFGSFPGRVASISSMVIDPRDTTLPIKVEEPLYKVVVTVDQQYVDAFGKRLPLHPGMALRANVILDRRSFLDWLLTPLRAVQNRT